MDEHVYQLSNHILLNAIEGDSEIVAQWMAWLLISQYVNDAQIVSIVVDVINLLDKQCTDIEQWKDSQRSAQLAANSDTDDWVSASIAELIARYQIEKLSGNTDYATLLDISTEAAMNVSYALQFDALSQLIKERID